MDSLSKSHGYILADNNGILLSKIFLCVDIKNPELISKMLYSNDLPYLLQKDGHVLDIEKQRGVILRHTRTQNRLYAIFRLLL